MTKNEMKEAMTEAMTEALIEVLWSDPVEDRLCNLTRDTVGGYLVNEEPYYVRSEQTGRLIERSNPVTVCEYLQSIERLLERIADALGA